MKLRMISNAKGDIIAILSMKIVIPQGQSAPPHLELHRFSFAAKRSMRSRFRAVSEPEAT